MKLRTTTLLLLLSAWLFGSAGCDQSQPKLLENATGQPEAADSLKAGETMPDQSQPPEVDAKFSLGSSDEASPLQSPVAPTFDPSAGPNQAVEILDSVPDGVASGAAGAIASGEPSNSETAQKAAEIMNRPFATLQPVDSDSPSDLIGHLREIDAAIRDLVIAGSNDIVEKQAFIDFGMRLGNMKLETGQRLSNNAQATEGQRKTGVMATVTALSHMSGLGDVESAKQLETLANSLSKSEDPELAHQSRVVLLGFELQALQNGLKSDAGALVEQVQGLFEGPEDRNFPEFMMGQQAFHVLTQMGYQDDAQQIQQILINEYQDSSDPQLRTQTWSYATRDSQALANYNQASRLLGSPAFNPQDLLVAARGLFNAFPSAQTLEQLAGSIANVEYGGQVELSQRLAEFVTGKLQDFDSSAASQAAAETLANHRARLSLLGQQPTLENLVDFDGQPIDWEAYRGKVILLDFWATWCVPCLKELPNLRKLHQQLQAEGFEIVGVNMDEQLDMASNFIVKQNLPWKNYHFRDATGFEAEFALQNGLNMIPFLVLIDREGKVRRLHVRGDELTTAVRDLLGLDTSLIP